MIYVIGEHRTGVVKIGWSVNPTSRLTTLRTGSPLALRLLAVFPGARENESALHRAFGSKRLRAGGEWFDFGQQDAAVAVASEMVKLEDAEAGGPRRAAASTPAVGGGGEREWWRTATAVDARARYAGARDRRVVPRVWEGRQLFMADRDFNDFVRVMRSRSTWKGARGGKV